MSQNRIIQFEYRTKDSIIQPDNCVISLFTEKISIRGERCQKVFDPVKIKAVKMTGLFIRYEGVEYGSITTNLVQLLAEISSCNCVEDEFRIFDDEFDLEFE